CDAPRAARASVRGRDGRHGLAVPRDPHRVRHGPRSARHVVLTRVLLPQVTLVTPSRSASERTWASTGPDRSAPCAWPSLARRAASRVVYPHPTSSTWSSQPRIAHLPDASRERSSCSGATSTADQRRRKV